MEKEFEETTSNLATMLLEYSEEVLDSVLRRHSTSTGNKDLHKSMAYALYSNNLEMIKTMVREPFYYKPLDGVIIMMEVDHTIKRKLLNSYKKIKSI